MRIGLQLSRTASPQLFHELSLSTGSLTEHDAASHTEDFRINTSTAIPRFEVILAAVSGQKRLKLLQLRNSFYVKVRKLTGEISRH
jgi:hypothetical protein